MRKFKRFFTVLLCLLLLLPNMSLNVFAAEGETTEMIDIPESSDWKGAIGGDVGGNDKITAENFLIKENGDGSVNMTVKNNRGKISSSSEGIAYYYQQVDPTDNYELTAKVKVESFEANGQVGFGIMLRGNLLTSTDEKTGDYLAVGGIKQDIRGFYKYSSASSIYPDELDFTANNPAPGEEYTLKLRKEGTIYQLTVGEETKTFTDYTGEMNYVGLFAARNVSVTYSDVNLNKYKKVQRLEVNSDHMKTEYLTDEELNLDGLVVKAIYDTGEESTLSANEYIVTGFDSSTVGTNTIKISYGGAVSTIDLTINALTLNDLSIKYFPAKTVYYPGDKFESAGLQVFGSYNNGETYELSAEQYNFKIDDVTLDDSFEFKVPGTKTVSIVPKDFPAVTASFNVTVKDTELEGLEIKKQPVKTQYFIGDPLDLTGMVVYATYKDGSQVRLLENEYDVSNFDTTTPGDKNVVISHKDASKTITFNVKEKEVHELKITTFPSTTFTIGDIFASDGLEVSKVYDNGDLEVLSTDSYVIDSSSFNSGVAGTYSITVNPKVDFGVSPITYKVTVRDNTEYKFDFIRFGQSTSDEKNTIEYLENDTVRLAAIDGGGKVTGDHDGISFYYTEIDANEDNFELSADIKVVEYAKNPHDGQESFGIMARDAIYETGDQKGIFASNIAAIGGYSGGTRDENGTQLFVRTGVTSPDGTGSQGIQNEMVKAERPTTSNTHPNKTYRLTLKKTNSGFTGILNDGEKTIEKEIYAPDLLNVQNGKAYVGFYAARVATIEVSNIDFEVTAAETDAPKGEAPVKEVTPQFDILSLERTSDANYRLIVQSNVNGTVTIKEGNETIRYDEPIIAGQKLEIQTKIAKNANTNFSFVFIPDETQKLTDYNRIIQNFTVEMKTFAEDGNIYVSPNGLSSGDGSKENPLDLDTAIEFVKPGQHIYVMEGRYVRNAILEIKKYNDGTEDGMKYLWADPSATSRPIIDFDKKTEGVIHSGNYWHVKGIDFIQSAGNTKGYTVGGNHNIIENIKTYQNGDTGLQISRTDNSTNIADWPSYNLILNSESFDNRDPSDNNADGFAAKLTVGEGNIFRGTISHNNIDDGWDLYTKVGTGAIGAVTIEDSIAYNNGFLTDGTVGNGDKNGFKLGGEGVHVPHIIKNSVAFGNGAAGFTSNSNPGVIAENNYAINNAGVNMAFITYGHITPDFTIDGFISFFTEDSKMKTKDNYQHADSDKNFMFNGEQSVNKSGDVLPDEIIQSLATIQNFERSQDGEIDWNGVWDTFGDFMAQYDEPNTENPEEPGKEQPEEPNTENPEQPGEETPDNEEDNNQPGDQTPSSDQTGDNSQGTDKQKDSNKLPKTATSVYNWLVLGILFIFIGISVGVVLYRRKGLVS
ncbi:bacterial Ig-like domain-containing protein [Fredinandcohnia salidurans]|uniref:Bacterial Ig-like domain-containing protein n=1 Tax=Fredinandcohnia salidurans TaxID=2595041 RepID=A0ABW4MUL5_9BACI